MAYESRHGSDKAQKKKKYNRHTPEQTQELESFFQVCRHPDEKQRSDLGKRLGLENKQVKFWFQNRRTQVKAQLEHSESMLLRQENEQLQAENNVMKEVMANSICSNCGGPAIPRQISTEEQQIILENALLENELNRVYTLYNSAMASMPMQTQNSDFYYSM